MANPEGVIINVDCERKGYVVIRLLRLGQSDARYVLSVEETPGRKVVVRAKSQLEGDSLIAGQECLERD